MFPAFHGRILSVSLLFLLPGASNRPAAAQLGGTGLIEGRVLDDFDAPVPDAEIVVTRLQPGLVRRILTDRAGVFRVAFLPPGTYRVTARRIGHRGVILEPVTVRGGQVEVVHLALARLATTLEPLLVTVPALRIRPWDTEFGGGIRAREISLLPVSNEVRDLVGFLPGARTAQIWGGATAQANSYQLDGVGMNHPGLGGSFIELSPFWIEELEVKGLGAGAELGGFQGGIVNIVTKSGTDVLEGSVRVAGETSRLNASNLRPGETGSELGERREVDVEVRGPVKRDRLFFAAFGQLIGREYRVTNRVRQVPGDLVAPPPEDTELRLLGKLSWHPRPGDQVAGSLGLLRGTAERTAQDGFRSPEATERGDSRTVYYSLSWERTLSSRAFLALKIAGYDGNDRREPYGGSAAPGILTIEKVDPRAFQNAPLAERREPTSLGFSIGTDWSFRLAGTGHRLRVGAEHLLGSWRFEQRRNGGLTWRPGDRTTAPLLDPEDPSTWIWNSTISSTWGGEVSLNSEVENSAAWIQDYIALTPRLHLNPGLRWGRWVGRLHPSGSAAVTPVRDHAVEPRIGLGWSGGRANGFAVKVHWGRFHQSLFAGFFDRAAGGNVFTDEERWEFLGPPFADPRTTFTFAERTALAQAGTFRFAERIRLSETGPVEGYRQPYVEQAVFGLEKTFGPKWKAEAVYVRRRNRNMVALIDRALATNYTIYENVAVLDRFQSPVFFDGKPLVLPRIAVSNEDILYWLQESRKPGVICPQCIPPELTAAELNALRYEPDYVLTNAPDASRRFDQIQLRLETRHETWWVSASGTLTRLEGNLNSVTGPDDYSLSGAGPYVRLNEQFNGFGDLSNQSDVEIKVQAGGSLGWGLRGGAFVTHFTGDRVTPTLTLGDLYLEFTLDRPELTRDPALSSIFFRTTSGQRIFLLPRGSFRYPAQTRMDLHLERAFRMGRSETIVGLDGFNVLGAGTVSEIQTSVSAEVGFGGASTYGQIRRRVPPRTLRLSATMRF